MLGGGERAWGGGEPARYTWPGYLLFRRDRALLAQPFDAKRLTLTAEPSVLAEAVDPGGFSASETGVLAFASSPPETTQPTWYDRSGRALGPVGEPGAYIQIALSRDARRAAVQRLDPRLQTSDIWLLDLARGTLSRFTSDPGIEGDPVWSPDGRRLAFSARGDKTRGRLAIFHKGLGGGPEESLLPETAGWAFVEDWSRDGRLLFYGAGIGGRDGLWAVPLVGDRKPFPVVRNPVPNDEAQLSPDGRVLAYMSYESGRFEVYVVQAFPAPGPRARVSTEGGSQPRWRGDGRELFYLAPDGALMAVNIEAESTLEPGVPRKLFSLGLRPPTLRPVWGNGRRPAVPGPRGGRRRRTSLDHGRPELASRPEEVGLAGHGKGSRISRKPNLRKSESRVKSVRTPCCFSSAARCASGTRLPRTGNPLVTSR